uniref:RING-type E3 ubiquitin transferase n=1 Tax=Kalanchoe fedtschenkoi TaxID=63787 RepID=A0A7N0VI11_KALFE
MEVERRGGDEVVKPVALGSKFPLSLGEMMVASGVLLSFLVGLLGVYFTLPDSDYSFLKLPRNLEDLQILSSSFVLNDSIRGHNNHPHIPSLPPNLNTFLPPAISPIPESNLYRNFTYKKKISKSVKRAVSSAVFRIPGQLEAGISHFPPMSSPPPIPTPQATYSSPPVTVVLTILLLIFFFVGFFSVYFCRCFSESIMATWNNRLTQSGTNPRPNAAQNASSAPGLDLQIIQTFPIFKYSAVKDLRRGKIELECAICLSEFADDDFLRLLTICCHVFHQDCVDLWLESHKTCPVCRSALDSPPDEKSLPKAPDSNNGPTNEYHLSHHGSDGSVRISIKEDDDGDEDEIQNTQSNGSTGIQNARSNIEAISKRRATAEKFSRCHSTGHSIFRNKVEDVEKYTLRLPEHVKEQITKGHQWAKSCTHFGEYSANSAKQGTGFGEMSGASGGDVDQV